MKLKSDFVTNSSSTSFVMIGWMVDFPDIYSKKRELVSKVFEKNPKKLTEEDVEELFFEMIHRGSNGLDFQIGETWGAPDDNTILVGMRIGLINDEVIESTERKFSMKELKEVLKRTKEKFNIKERPKVLTGWLNT